MSIGDMTGGKIYGSAGPQTVAGNYKASQALAEKLAQEKMEAYKQAFMKDINNNYLKKDEQGLLSVAGGVNEYGMTRPDHLLLRDKDNKIQAPFAETMGESYKQLQDYGKTFGSDVDARAKMGMGDAYNKINEQAMGTGDLEATALMRGQLNNQTSRDLGRFNTQAANSLNSTMGQMAMRGGVSSGAMERMGRLSNRDAMMGRQGINAQNRDQNLQLSINNAQTRNDMLRDVGQVQQSNNQYNANAFTNNQNRQLDALSRSGGVEQDINKSNINAARQDVQEQNLSSHNFYTEDMQAYGAKQQADAQRKASKPSSGCCFIFLEARYGNGSMDKVVRRFRDENVSLQNQRGYYKLSEVLVPLMRKYKVVKLATRLLMTDPMVAYGKAYYGGNKLGYIFKPVVSFWLGMFNFLGADHEFIRENGELI